MRLKFERTVPGLRADFWSRPWFGPVGAGYWLTIEEVLDCIRKAAERCS